MSIPELRKKIDAMNRKLVELLGERLEVAREIARLKKQERLPILDASREDAIKAEMRVLAKEHGISPPIVEEMFQILLDYTRLEMESVS
jgi:chorismate mutase